MSSSRTCWASSRCPWANRLVTRSNREMVESGQLPAAINPSHTDTNELVAEINKFNEAAVTAKDKGM